MLQDAWEDNCDLFIVVSGDSDLVPAVMSVKEFAPQKQVKVYIPARSPLRGAAVELRSAADKARILPNELLAKCQFAPKLPDGTGGFITKPPSW